MVDLRFEIKWFDFRIYNFNYKCYNDFFFYRKNLKKKKVKL